MGIVESICEHGRFLKRDKLTWREASFETARQKVAHAMQYRQRCLLSTAPDFNEESIDVNESTLSSFKYDVQTSDESTDNNFATKRIEGGLLNTLPTAYSEEFDFSNPKRTSRQVTDDVQSEGANYNIYAPLSIELALLTRMDRSSPVDSLFLNLERSMTSTTTETCPTKMRVVSNEMSLQVPNVTYCQQLRSTLDCTSNKQFCFREQGTLSDLDFVSSHLSQPLNATIGKNEVLLPTSSDEQTAEVLIPPPYSNLLRGTSDFSFGDFSLDGKFVSSIEDGDHQNV